MAWNVKARVIAAALLVAVFGANAVAHAGGLRPVKRLPPHFAAPRR